MEPWRDPVLDGVAEPCPAQARRRLEPPGQRRSSSSLRRAAAPRRTLTDEEANSLQGATQGDPSGRPAGRSRAAPAAAARRRSQPARRMEAGLQDVSASLILTSSPSYRWDAQGGPEMAWLNAVPDRRHRRRAGRRPDTVVVVQPARSPPALRQAVHHQRTPRRRPPALFQGWPLASAAWPTGPRSRSSPRPDIPFLRPPPGFARGC